MNNLWTRFSPRWLDLHRGGVDPVPRPVVKQPQAIVRSTKRSGWSGLWKRPAGLVAEPTPWMTDRRKDLQRFEELERLAQDWLGKPQLLLPELGRAALRLWQADQQSRTCWLLCKNWKSPSGLADEPAMLRKAVWHRAADFERFRDPLVGGRLGLHLRPTVSYQDAEVSSELVIELLDSLHACSVQLSRCTTLHLGWGVNRAVDAGTEWPSFRFAWSHNPPPPIGWEALDRWFSQAWARIEAQT